MNKLAFIGGYNPEILTDLHSETIETPYGTAKYELGYFKDKPIVFMARHGVNHTIPPHKINFRANIYALKALGVSSIVSTTAVGSPITSPANWYWLISSSIRQNQESVLSMTANCMELPILI